MILYFVCCRANTINMFTNLHITVICSVLSLHPVVPWGGCRRFPEASMPSYQVVLKEDSTKMFCPCGAPSLTPSYMLLSPTWLSVDLSSRTDILVTVHNVNKRNFTWEPHKYWEECCLSLCALRNVLCYGLCANRVRHLATVAHRAVLTSKSSLLNKMFVFVLFSQGKNNRFCPFPDGKPLACGRCRLPAGTWSYFAVMLHSTLIMLNWGLLHILNRQKWPTKLLLMLLRGWFLLTTAQ